MYKNLENYLEEISHFLSGRNERGEILSEIRSHILEKAEQEAGPLSEASLQKIIASYGRPRQVAERYLEDKPVIAPAYQRFLFRYTVILFAIHLAFTVFAVVFRQSFVVFPFLFMPRLGIIDAVMYLPMAFLSDFGFVALVLYFITRSGREVRLPWPKFALDLDEVKAPEGKTLAARVAAMVGAGIMLALTGLTVGLYLKFQTIFFVSRNLGRFQPLLAPAPGRQISLIFMAMLAVGTIALLVKSFSRSPRLACWVNAASGGVALVLIGMLLRQTYAGLFAVRITPAFLPKIRFVLTFVLLFIALLVAVDLVANLVRLGRKRLGK
jgi:hypothetical protein